MRTMNSFEFKEIRGWILRFLYNLLPKFGSAESVAGMLLKAGYDVTALQVQGHFRYLEDKEYVELQEIDLQEMSISRHLAKLTSKGVDFVEGNLPDDPGICRK